MGRRILWVDSQFLVEMLKKPGEQRRSFDITDDPLPNDTRIVDEWRVPLILESAEWGDGITEVRPPTAHVYWEADDAGREPG